MQKINLWSSRSSATGGVMYDSLVAKILDQQGYEVCNRDQKIEYKGKGHTYLLWLHTYLFTSSDPSDLDIMDFTTTVNSSQRHKGKRISIFHHHTDRPDSKYLRQKLMIKMFKSNSSNNHLVVAVSKFWQEYLNSIRISNVRVIYNAFEVEQYVQHHSRQDFLEQYSLLDRPIIYLGKNEKWKTYNAYQRLKHFEKKFSLVTTGSRQEVEGPIHLDLNFRSYCSLLHLAKVTVLLPDFAEGWSRIAHESIMCGTPVIGNGAGGMAELLDLFGQININDQAPDFLPEKVLEIVEMGKRVEKSAVSRSREFDLDYFSREWGDIVDKTIAESK